MFQDFFHFFGTFWLDVGTLATGYREGVFSYIMSNIGRWYETPWCKWQKGDHTLMLVTSGVGDRYLNAWSTKDHHT